MEKNLFNALILFILLFPGEIAFSQSNEVSRWKTWIIPSSFNPDAIVKNETHTPSQFAFRSDSASQRIVAYWSAGAPGYRWNEFAIELIERDQLKVGGARVMALMNIAIYDATMVMMRSKAFSEMRPLDKKTSSQDVRNSAATAAANGAASAMLGFLFPKDTNAIRQKSSECSRALQLKGASSSFVDTWINIGKHSASFVVDYAGHDGYDAVWNGTQPAGEQKWKGTNPLLPALSLWKPYVLKSANQFRPAAPPDFSQEMEDLKKMKHSLLTDRLAFHWGISAIPLWNDVISKEIFEYHLDQDPVEASRVYALTSVALCDALISCWDAKFTYWTIRPFQLDTSFKPLLETPNHPGYPSGHSSVAGAEETVLSYLFPFDTAYFHHLAEECALSRCYAGVHFTTDNTVGLDLGRKVGTEVVKRAIAME